MYHDVRELYFFGRIQVETKTKGKAKSEFTLKAQQTCAEYGAARLCQVMMTGGQKVSPPLNLGLRKEE
jgi:hypothetical protein